MDLLRKREKKRIKTRWVHVKTDVLEMKNCVLYLGYISQIEDKIAALLKSDYSIAHVFSANIIVLETPGYFANVS